jgi:hypothetical protein
MTTPKTANAVSIRVDLKPLLRLVVGAVKTASLPDATAAAAAGLGAVDDMSTQVTENGQKIQGAFCE